MFTGLEGLDWLTPVFLDCTFLSFLTSHVIEDLSFLGVMACFICIAERVSGLGPDGMAMARPINLWITAVSSLFLFFGVAFIHSHFSH